MWRTPATLGERPGRWSIRGRAQPRAGLTDPRARDELRRHVRRGDRRRGRGSRAERDLLAGGARPLRRGRPRDRLAPPPASWSNADRRACARASAGVTLDDIGSSRPRRAPAWSARCSSGCPRPRRWRRRASCRSPPVDHLQGHVAANFLPTAASLRAAVPVPDRQRRAHAARPRRDARRLRGARAHARRRRGRGVRQGRADARPGLPGRRRRSSVSRRRAIPRRSRFPGSARRALARRARRARAGVRAEP